MGNPIDRTAKAELDLNLVNGVTSDAPKLKANNDVLYDYVDYLNGQLDQHASASVIPHPDGSVTTAKIANNAITQEKIANNAVGTAKIADGAITSAKIAEQAVTTSKIADQSITKDKIVGGSITTEKIADGAITASKLDKNMTTNETINNVLIRGLKSHTSGYLNAKEYNAAGDGVTDDTQALQQMLVDAYRMKKSVKIPSGEYLIRKPLVIIADKYELESSISIEGENLEHVVIKCSEDFTPHLSEGILSNTAAFIVVDDTFLNEDNTLMNGNSNGVTHSVFMSNLYLLCQYGNVDYGILFGVMNASSSYKQIRTRGFAKAGFKNLNHFYLNILEKIRVDLSPISFDFDMGIKTSVKLDSCYSYGATDTAYKVKGIYMLMDNCCADACTGTVFDLRGYSGTVNSPGSESDQAKIMFRFDNRSRVTINGAYTWGNYDDPEAIHVYAGAGCNVVFNGGYILFDRTETYRTAPGYLIRKGIYANVTFVGTKIGKYEKQNEIIDYTIRSSYLKDRGSIHTRHSDNVSFIGFDVSDEAIGYVDYESTNPKVLGNAIYMGFGPSRNVTDDGKDMQWSRPNFQGDIILTRHPKTVGGIGWIQASDTSTHERWAHGQYLKIPVVLSGTTAERPIAELQVGQMYYDTTLGTYIYYAGSNQWKKIKDDVVV